MISRREDGVTLIELMIAMAIGIILVALTYTLMNSQAKAISSSRSTSEMEDNLRVAMDLLARDVRSSGFLLPAKGAALRIENNCGASATGSASAAHNSGKVDWASGIGFTIPGPSGTAIDGNGQFVGDTTLDGCPNGSDRITLTARPTNAFVAGNPNGNQKGYSFQWDVTCPGGDCGSAVQNGGIPGGTCACTAACMSASANLCSPTDPFACMMVQADYTDCVDGVGGCKTATSDCYLNVTYFPSGAKVTTKSAWTLVSGKTTAALQSWQTRTYQLMDLDGDGSTELVYSDDVNALFEAGAAAQATWVPVANYIDDLQFAVAFQSAPNTFIPGANVWDLGPNCTEDIPNNRYCLAARIAANDPPVAIRITVVGRTARREQGVSGIAPNFVRTQVEDNNPPPAVFNAAGPWPSGAANCFGAQPCGCGPAGGPPPAATAKDYASCTENGNALGYRRRVLTEIIGLRNLAL